MYMYSYDDPSLPIVLGVGFTLTQICPGAGLDQFCRDVSTLHM